MSKEPKSLTVVKTPVRGQEELINRLEKMLEAAKAGELKAIFFVELNLGKYWHPGWAGDVPERLMSVGALEALKYELFLEASDEA